MIGYMNPMKVRYYLWPCIITILYHSRWLLTWILNQNVISRWPSWEANWLLCLPNWDCESIWCLYDQEMITPAKIRNPPMTRDLWPLALKHGQAWWVQKKHKGKGTGWNVDLWSGRWSDVAERRRLCHRWTCFHSPGSWDLLTRSKLVWIQ